MMQPAIPARPKGAPGPTKPPLEDFLQSRAATAPHVQEIPKPPGSYFNEGDPFADFAQIVHILKRHPKPTQRHIIGVIAELLLGD